MIKTHRNFVNGKFLDAVDGDIIPVLNPSTEAVISKIPNTNAAVVNDSVAAAKSAQKLYGVTTKEFNKTNEVLQEHKSLINELEFGNFS